jgi:DNA modification methylase
MTVSILCGDCRNMLRQMPAESVHCVVTSPPYWGLRDYGTATWEGGDPTCDHRQAARKPADWSTSGLQRNKKSPELSAGTIALVNHQQEPHYRDLCGKCGARRVDSQIGLEPDLHSYVAAMVGVFREVRRVLRKDGTLWLNLGDSYAASVNGRSAADTKALGNDDRTFRDKPFSTVGNGLKPKDLCGIPWRVAFALQADGWWLRQDIIWSKPNPMPESVTDRCTKAHEYLFLLSKSERYYYDAEAIKEKVGEETRRQQTFRGGCYTNNTAFNNSHDYAGHAPYSDGDPSLRGRNKRSVWEVTTQPFSEAHFATFPFALIEPCIKAGCPADGTVLDPFAGAGTTGLVADRLRRNAILIELKPEYAAMARRRIEGDAPLFVQVNGASQQTSDPTQKSWADMWAKPFDFSQLKDPSG